MNDAISYICVAATAFAVTFFLTPLAKRLAVRLDAVDYPSKRRINTTPIPRLGGLAVFGGLVAAFVVQLIGTWYLGWPPVLVSHPSMAVNYPMLAFALTLMMLIGAADDIFQLPPRAKLAGQIIAAIIAVAGGLVIHTIVNPLDKAYVDLGWASYPLTVLYLVAFTNIINLIDGLDGLATGISGIAAVSMFSFAVLAGRTDAAAFSIALVGCCLAFLRYNFHPASIFLGDAGSLQLGFALGMISLLNVNRTAALTSLLIPLIVAGVPIIDTFSAIVRRMRAHVSIGHADKGHIHHRLIQEGYDQRQAVLLIYLWCIMLSIGAATINQVGAEMRVVIFLILLICSAAFAIHLHLFEPVLRHHYNPETDEDEFVTPEDPEFAEEERTARDKRRRSKRRVTSAKAAGKGETDSRRMHLEQPVRKATKRKRRQPSSHNDNGQ